MSEQEELSPEQTWLPWEPVADPHPPLDRLSQDRYWWDVENRRRPILEMEVDYICNVLAFLEEDAVWLHRLALLTDEGQTEGLAAAAPEEWVHQTPLFRALRAALESEPLELAGKERQ